VTIPTKFGKKYLPFSNTDWQKMGFLKGNVILHEKEWKGRETIYAE